MMASEHHEKTTDNEIEEIRKVSNTSNNPSGDESDEATPLEKLPTSSKSTL